MELRNGLANLIEKFSSNEPVVPSKKQTISNFGMSTYKGINVIINLICHIF